MNDINEMAENDMEIGYLVGSLVDDDDDDIGDPIIHDDPDLQQALVAQIPVPQSRRDVLLARLSQLENKWNLEPTMNSYKNVLELFNIDSQANLNPMFVEEKYQTAWESYKTIHMEYDNVCVDENIDLSSAEEEDVVFRFNQIKVRLFNARESLMAFFRATNAVNQFPPSRHTDEIFWYQQLDLNELPAVPKLILYCLGRLYRAGVRRHCGEYVYEQIILNGKPTRAWREKCELRTMIWEFCNKDSSFLWWRLLTQNNADSVVKYLSTCLDREFPEFIPNRRCWSFLDGIYVAETDTFFYYDDPTIPDGIVSCKLIEQEFGNTAYYSFNGIDKLVFSQIQTPIFDKILKSQKWSDEIMYWLYVYLGRLFYEVREKDKWETCAFCKGVAGTGKSSILKLVEMFYNARDIGVIGNNIERNFGLHVISEKLVFIAPEIKSDFALDQANLQSMITGENVSLAIKHKEPKVVNWKVSGILAGNEAPSWSDNSGSISRRLVIFPFNERISDENKDPNLMKKVEEQELSKLIRKCSLAYTDAFTRYGNVDIWSVLPRELKEERVKLQYSTNPLFAYIHKSNECEFDEHGYINENAFSIRLRAYAKVTFPSINFCWNADFYSYVFNELHLTVERKSLTWPRSSENITTGLYIMGLKFTMDN